MSWTVRVPMIPKSLNRRLRTHWGLAAKEKKAWLEALFYLFASAKVPPPQGKRLVTITRLAHGILDEDNLVASCKEVIVDNLKPAKFEQGVYKSGKRKGEHWHRSRQGLGLIREDDPAWVKVIYRQTRVPRAEAEVTIITIEET